MSDYNNFQPTSSRKYINVEDSYGTFSAKVAHNLEDRGFQGDDITPPKLLGKDMLPFLERLEKQEHPNDVAIEAADFIYDQHWHD